MSKIHYSIERAKDKQFYVNIIKNKKVIFTSETYRTKISAKKAIKAIGGDLAVTVDNAPNLPKGGNPAIYNKTKITKK